jgi:hypothetical protein
MANWWIADDHLGVLSVAMFFLFLGGFFGGATVAGSEWRAGTITTVLTWEPRRLRLHSARLGSGAILAFLISFGLQVIFLAAFVPAVVFNGTADGVDGSFWLGLVVVVARTSVFTAAAAILAMSLAIAARNTAFAVIAMFAWIVVVEGLIRVLKPSLSSWLWGETVTTVTSWSRLDNVELARGPVMSAVTLAAYVAVIAGGAAISFQRRDIAAGS